MEPAANVAEGRKVDSHSYIRAPTTQLATIEIAESASALLHSRLTLAPSVISVAIMASRRREFRS